jgi:hypothetical protein
MKFCSGTRTCGCRTGIGKRFDSNLILLLVEAYKQLVTDCAIGAPVIVLQAADC